MVSHHFSWYSHKRPSCQSTCSTISSEIVKFLQTFDLCRDFCDNDFRKWPDKLRKSVWQLKAIVCLQSLLRDRSELWIASDLSVCLGKTYYIWLISCSFPLKIPYWLLSMSRCWERWIHSSVRLWCFVCYTNVEQDDVSCPKSLQPRENRCCRADFICSFTLCFILSTCNLAVTGSMCLVGGSSIVVFCQWVSVIVKRDKRDLACYSCPFPPKCHFALLY